MSSTIEIPVCDFQSSNQKLFALKLGKALRERRIVALENHGIHRELFENKFNLDKKLFSLPNITTYRAGSIDQGGFFSEGKEYTTSSRAPDKKRMWQIYREIPIGDSRYEVFPKNKWPKEMPVEFRRRRNEIRTTTSKHRPVC